MPVRDPGGHPQPKNVKQLAPPTQPMQPDLAVARTRCRVTELFRDPPLVQLMRGHTVSLQPTQLLCHSVLAVPRASLFLPFSYHHVHTHLLLQKGLARI